MRTLTELRENKTKREIQDNKREYNNPSSISLIAQIIKMQNILLIKWISRKKSLSKDDEEYLFAAYKWISNGQEICEPDTTAPCQEDSDGTCNGDPDLNTQLDCELSGRDWIYDHQCVYYEYYFENDGDGNEILTIWDDLNVHRLILVNRREVIKISVTITRHDQEQLLENRKF